MTGEQRERIKQVGRHAFIREEMERLGFWPPDAETAAKNADAEAQLKILYAQMAGLRTDLDAVEGEIAAAADIPALIAEVRKRRIERVRAERAVQKVERAKTREEKGAVDAQRRRTTLPFLGRGVSAGLVYEGGEPEKVAGLSLPALASASDVARAIGVDERELAFLTYHRTAASLDHYHRFTIPKKRGAGVRVISSPKKRLRVAQRWLLANVLCRLPVHENAMAFVPGRSIADNAARHAGRAIVVRIDLKDFFPSIGVGRVKGLFRSLGYNEGVATLFALLATESPRVAVIVAGEPKRFVSVGGRCLPQGACTSPAVTNVLCRRLDARLTGASGALGFAYTRYADDLVFSHERPDAAVGALLTVARKILGEERFTVNEEKTRVMRAHQRQVVTGLIVNAVNGNAAARVSRDDLRRFRAFLHQCETRGFDTMTQATGQDARAYASGYVSFIHMVRPDHAAKLRAAHPWLVRGKETAAS